MRQGQQNRRGRGRGRKVQNPLSRNYESNGPSVKIRGTAAHVAEKYMTLARDALASGDNVMAENFLQHAEHYNRIIMSAQAQFTGGSQPGAEGANGSGGHRPQHGDGNRQGNDTGAMHGQDQSGDGNDGGNAHHPGQDGANGAGRQHSDATPEDAQGSANG